MTMLGVSTKVATASLVGGAIGSVLGQGRWWERMLRGLVGSATAYVGHHVTATILVALLDIPFDPPNLPTVEEMEPVAAFLIGLVGMVLCQAVINAMMAVRDRADDFVDQRMGHDEDATK